MITANIEVTWNGDDETFFPGATFTKDFEILPNVGDRVRLGGEHWEKMSKLAKDHNIDNGRRICYVRRFVNDGSTTPTIRLGPDPQKLHLMIYRASSDDPKYNTLHYFVAPGALPRRGDQIHVITKTESGEEYDKWLYIKHIYFDQRQVHVATSVNRVEPIVEASIPKAVNANIMNTVTAYVDNTVCVEPNGSFPVEVENRHPIDVEISNRCVYVSNYDKYGD